LVVLTCLPGAETSVTAALIFRAQQEGDRLDATAATIDALKHTAASDPLSVNTVNAAIADLEQKDRHARQKYAEDKKQCKDAWKAWRGWLQQVQK
jgi:hypothetical protein